MTLRGLLYSWYSRHLKRQLAGASLPHHVGLVMDGNRRWARQMGFDSPSEGHRHGAAHVERVLGWCADVGVTHVTVFVMSADNLRKRSPEEIRFLTSTIERVAMDRAARPSSRWQLHTAGDLDALPDSTREALKLAENATAGASADAHLTVAIGYDGREEIVNAVAALLDEHARLGATPAEVAELITVDDIAAYLYTSGQPEPDLVIRTSGEVRTSGFLLWQAAHAELYFCDVYWPAFRQIDFLRALRTYAVRRSGSR